MHAELSAQLDPANYIPLDPGIDPGIDPEPGLPPLIRDPETPARIRPETPETLEESVRSIRYVEERVTELLSSPTRTLYQKTNTRTLAHFETQRIITNQVHMIHFNAQESLRLKSRSRRSIQSGGRLTVEAGLAEIAKREAKEQQKHNLRESKLQARLQKKTSLERHKAIRAERRAYIKSKGGRKHTHIVEIKVSLPESTTQGSPEELEESPEPGESLESDSDIDSVIFIL